MKKTILFILILSSNITLAQKLTKVPIATEDPHSFYVNDGEATNLFYYELVPKQKPIGTLVIIPSGGETAEDMLAQISLHNAAVQENILVIIPSYNWGTIKKVPEIQFFDSLFARVIKEHAVDKNKFVLCGLSNGGIQALTYGIRAVRDGNTFLTPAGIIGIDPPLDNIHFYEYCQREIKRNFSEAGVAEAKWLLESYQKTFGGTPVEQAEQYIHFSIFSYGVDSGGNAQYLNNIPIQMYSDLNIDYLLNERHRDLYDWNGTDIVAFVNQLKIMGNKNAEVFISQNKGQRPNGNKHPHSWNILDTDKSLEWIIELFK